MALFCIVIVVDVVVVVVCLFFGWVLLLRVKFF